MAPDEVKIMMDDIVAAIPQLTPIITDEIVSIIFKGIPDFTIADINRDQYLGLVDWFMSIVQGYHVTFKMPEGYIPPETCSLIESSLDTILLCIDILPQRETVFLVGCMYYFLSTTTGYIYPKQIHEFLTSEISRTGVQCLVYVRRRLGIIAYWISTRIRAGGLRRPVDHLSFFVRGAIQTRLSVEVGIYKPIPTRTEEDNKAINLYKDLINYMIEGSTIYNPRGITGELSVAKMYNQLIITAKIDEFRATISKLRVK